MCTSHLVCSKVNLALVSRSHLVDRLWCYYPYKCVLREVDEQKEIRCQQIFGLLRMYMDIYGPLIDEQKEIRCQQIFGCLRMYMDIYGPFPTASWNSQQILLRSWTILCYGYLYLIYERSKSLEVFKAFKIEVENQLGKSIKTIRSNHGSEYYGRYDESGEHYPEPPFAKFLEEYGIVPQ